MVVKSVTLVLTWVLIYRDASKDDFIGRFFVVGAVVLAFYLYFVLLELFDDLLDRVLEKSLK